MRILHLIPSLAGGGGERQLAYLADGLVRHGVEVHVLYIESGANHTRLQASGATLHQLSGAGNHDPSLLLRIYRIIKKIRPSLVQTWFRQMDIYGGVAAKLADVPWIVSERSSAAAYSDGLKHRLRRLLARKASMIISNSTSGDKYWNAYLDSRIRRFIVPNALPLEEIAAIQPFSMKDAPLPAEDNVVLFAGRFAPERNLPALLSAFSEVLATKGRVAVMCGEGPLRANIEQSIRNLAMPHVRLPGYLPEQELWRWMKRADVFVSASLFEGRPNAVMEAMACGCPLVVSDIPEHREFLNESTALLVNPASPREIAAAINHVLSDKVAAMTRVEAARQIAKQWSIDKMTQQYEHIYQTLIEESSASHRPIKAGR
jgi:glycosyltransferase involved in cell wall biosynthesis